MVDVIRTDNIADGRPGVSIVIPNYNGEQLIREYLPSVVMALNHYGNGELIVVDDCSNDNSVQLLRTEFPSVKVLINEVNLGFSGTCNVGMNAAVYPFALCINTDVRAELDFIEPLLKTLLSDPDNFAVTPRVLVEREGKNQGAVISAYRKGFVRGGFIKIEDNLPSRENLYAIGACVLYDLAKFRALNGYSDVYAPFLFEDVDISYRAWKRGWKSIYEPGSTVWHYSNATIYRDKKKARQGHIIYFRNRFIFHWVNLTDRDFVIKNRLFILLRLMFSFLWFNFTYYRAFWGAFKRLQAIQALRDCERPYRKLTDNEIIGRTGQSEQQPSYLKR